MPQTIVHSQNKIQLFSAMLSCVCVRELYSVRLMEAERAYECKSKKDIAHKHY